jgi:hypothetical protein
MYTITPRADVSVPLQGPVGGGGERGIQEAVIYRRHERIDSSPEIFNEVISKAFQKFVEGFNDIKGEKCK